MNTVAATTLNATEKANLLADIQGIIQNTTTGETVRVYSGNTSAIDFSSGVSSVGVVPDEVTAYLGPLTLREVSRSDGAYQVGDVRLLVVVGDLTTAPTTASTFEDSGGIRYAAINVDKDSLGLHYEIIGRRIE